MKCVIYKQGETYPGMATVTLERAATPLVFKRVPALVCETCGEEYVGEEVTRMLRVDAEEAIKAGVEVDVRYYRAAWSEERPAGYILGLPQAAPDAAVPDRSTRAFA